MADDTPTASPQTDQSSTPSTGINLDLSKSVPVSSAPSAGVSLDLSKSTPINQSKAGFLGGAMKPVAETVIGLGNMIGRGAEIMLGEPKGSLTATEVHPQPLSTTGELGDVAGNTAEWMAGEEGLKALGSIAGTASELANASKFIHSPAAWAEYLKESPKAAWLLKAIGSVGKGAATGAVIGGTQGAATGNAASGAERGAALGAAAGAVEPTVSAVKSAVKVIPKNPFRVAADALTGSKIQPELQGGVRQVWDNVATAENVPKPKPGISVRDMGEQVGDSVLARSKAAYKQIDDATGGRFSGLEKGLKNVNDELKFVTNDTEEKNLLIRKQRLVMQTDQAMDEAAKKGVDDSTIRQAKFDFKKAQAIYDTNHQIRMSTGGVRPGMKGSAEVPETVDAKKLMNRMNSMYNSGRLQEGIGDDNAEDLIGHSATAQKAARDVARNRKVAAIALPAAATAAGTVYEMSK